MTGTLLIKHRKVRFDILAIAPYEPERLPQGINLSCVSNVVALFVSYNPSHLCFVCTRNLQVFQLVEYILRVYKPATYTQLSSIPESCVKVSIIGRK